MSGRAAAAPDTLGELLRGEWSDLDGGPPIQVPVQAVAIERSLSGFEADLVAPLRLGRRIAVVSDATTRAVLGERVERALAGLAAIVPVVLDGMPHADVPTVDLVRRACAHADALVAVGSGTINDLCKYAAAKDSKPYAVFATAPSMNGYASKNAAITIDGHKMSRFISPMARRTLACCRQRPRGYPRWSRDSLCRSTAQADGSFASTARYAISARALALLAEDEPRAGRPQALLQGDLARCAPARTLIPPVWAYHLRRKLSGE